MLECIGKMKKNSMKTFSALIPLRIGSKGIPKKNIKKIAGKPLFEWVLRAALASEHIDEVFVSTESAEIMRAVEALGVGVKIIQRPVQLADDFASTEAVMLHALDKIASDYLVTIQATSPLLTQLDLDYACAQFIQNGDDSLLSAVRMKRFLWSEEGRPLNYNPKTRPRRQDFHGTLIENGAFYISDSTLLAETKTRLHGSIGIHEMPEDTFIELDAPADWLLVEQIINERLSHAA